MDASEPHEWDYVIVGSGFGGSVSALRLVEKGYRVLLLEQGRRWRAQDFPRTNWNLRKWLWMPTLGLRGIFQMRFLNHVTVLSGVGLGGGSLVYANTHPIPPAPFFEHPLWRDLADWQKELGEQYPRVHKMLGVNAVPFVAPADRLLHRVAQARHGPKAPVKPTQVAVYFGEPGREHPDPYFDGRGPKRRGCIRCGGCMTGCRHGAKNSLDQNYLYLAEAQGLTIRCEAHVDYIGHRSGPATGEDYFELRWREGLGRSPARQSCRARQVIVAAGVLGSVELLDRMRQREDALPRLSAQLGCRVRTNSEALIGITSHTTELDMSEGVAIGAIYDCGDAAHAELCRYGHGSGAFRAAVTPHMLGGRGVGKLVRGLLWSLRHPVRSFRTLSVRDWAKQTTILLYMRCGDESLRLEPKTGWRAWLPGGRFYRSRLEAGTRPTATMPAATALARAIAQECQGELVSLVTEAASDRPTTAHILGGCCIGAGPETGVIDGEHRCFGYPGLRVIDGSSLPVNPGVNPSSTIAAMAERVMARIPAKAQAS